MKYFFVLILLVLTTNLYAASTCDNFFSYGYPTSTHTKVHDLCRISYFVKYDEVTRDPIYSAELLIKENLVTTVSRVDKFKPDPDLPKGVRAELSDFNRSYDRGHMTPFEDVAITKESALQSFYLSNVAPQDLHMNRGIWRKVENYTRQWAKLSHSGVYVITGPIFSSDKHRTVGPGKVSVPDYFFKIVIDKTLNEAIAFVIPNKKPDKTPLKAYVVTVRQVEKLTSINFLPNLPRDNYIKDQISTRLLSDLK